MQEPRKRKIQAVGDGSFGGSFVFGMAEDGVDYATSNPDELTSDITAPGGAALEAEVPVPPGARIISHSLSGNRISLDLELPGGGRTILVYDLAERRVIARLAVVPE